MPKFRKKPIVVEAEQYTGPEFVEWNVSVPSDTPRGVQWYEDGRSNCKHPFVVTIHGQKTWVKPGDWILPEPDGVHFYPCKPDVFAATYEPFEPRV